MIESHSNSQSYESFVFELHSNSHDQNSGINDEIWSLTLSWSSSSPPPSWLFHPCRILKDLFNETGIYFCHFQRIQYNCRLMGIEVVASIHTFSYSLQHCHWNNSNNLHILVRVFVCVCCMHALGKRCVRDQFCVRYNHWIVMWIGIIESICLIIFRCCFFFCCFFVLAYALSQGNWMQKQQKKQIVCL